MLPPGPLTLHNFGVLVLSEMHTLVEAEQMQLEQGASLAHTAWHLLLPSHVKLPAGHTQLEAHALPAPQSGCRAGGKRDVDCVQERQAPPVYRPPGKEAPAFGGAPP